VLLVITCFIALIAAALTFFTGFGLGTLLMPTFALVLPVEAAVAATAIVHLANNLFKFAIVRRHVHWPTFARFALPAVPAALAGAWLLSVIAGLPALAEYTLLGRQGAVTPAKLAVGLLIVVFAVLELTPRFDALAFPKRLMPVGGVVSGILGGLSGHQGALRSAFLIRAGLTKEQFIATGVASSVAVDVSRLIVYGVAFFARDWAVLREKGALWAVGAACVCAFAGSVLGSRLVWKVTLPALRRFIGIALLLVGLALGAGLI